MLQKAQLWNVKSHEKICGTRIVRFKRIIESVVYKKFTSVTLVCLWIIAVSINKGTLLLVLHKQQVSGPWKLLSRILLASIVNLSSYCQKFPNVYIFYEVSNMISFKTFKLRSCQVTIMKLPIFYQGASKLQSTSVKSLDRFNRFFNYF